MPFTKKNDTINIMKKVIATLLCLFFSPTLYAGMASDSGTKSDSGTRVERNLEIKIPSDTTKNLNNVANAFLKEVEDLQNNYCKKAKYTDDCSKFCREEGIVKNCPDGFPTAPATKKLTGSIAETASRDTFNTIKEFYEELRIFQRLREKINTIESQTKTGLMADIKAGLGTLAKILNEEAGLLSIPDLFKTTETTKQITEKNFDDLNKELNKQKVPNLKQHNTDQRDVKLDVSTIENLSSDQLEALKKKIATETKTAEDNIKALTQAQQEANKALEDCKAEIQKISKNEDVKKLTSLEMCKKKQDELTQKECIIEKLAQCSKLTRDIQNLFKNKVFKDNSPDGYKYLYETTWAFCASSNNPGYGVIFENGVAKLAKSVSKIQLMFEPDKSCKSYEILSQDKAVEKLETCLKDLVLLEAIQKKCDGVSPIPNKSGTKSLDYYITTKSRTEKFCDSEIETLKNDFSINETALENNEVVKECLNTIQNEKDLAECNNYLVGAKKIYSNNKLSIDIGKNPQNCKTKIETELCKKYADTKGIKATLKLTTIAGNDNYDYSNECKNKVDNWIDYSEYNDLMKKESELLNKVSISQVKKYLNTHACNEVKEKRNSLCNDTSDKPTLTKDNFKKTIDDIKSNITKLNAIIDVQKEINMCQTKLGISLKGVFLNTDEAQKACFDALKKQCSNTSFVWKTITYENAKQQLEECNYKSDLDNLITLANQACEVFKKLQLKCAHYNVIEDLYYDCSISPTPNSKFKEQTYYENISSDEKSTMKKLVKEYDYISKQYNNFNLDDWYKVEGVGKRCTHNKYPKVSKFNYNSMIKKIKAINW